MSNETNDKNARLSRAKELKSRLNNKWKSKLVNENNVNTEITESTKITELNLNIPHEASLQSIELNEIIDSKKTADESNESSQINLKDDHVSIPISVQPVPVPPISIPSIPLPPPPSPEEESTKTPESVKRLTPYDFEPLAVLGRGAFGKVYLVRKRDSVGSEVYAMKKMLKSVMIVKNQVDSKLDCILINTNVTYNIFLYDYFI